MPHGNGHVKWPGQAVLASLLVALVLLLDAMVASPALHSLIHPDADQAGHECAVTMFLHGQVDTAVVAVAVILPAIPVEVLPHHSISVGQARVESLPPGRGPPVPSCNS